MMRNLKVLSITAMAVLVVCAIGAAGVQAATFSAASSPVTIISTPDGTGKTAHQVLDFAGASLTSNKITFDGTMSNSPVEAIETSSITYSESNFIGQPATVHMNGCNFNFEAGGNIDINCPAGKEITISVPNPVCDVVFPSQQNKGTVTYHNIVTGTSQEITVSMNVTGLVYTATGPGCPIAGTFANGTYTTGNFIFTGENGSGTVNIQHNP